MSRCTITSPHCSHCGSTDREDANPFENDGYSTCCNEPVSTIASQCRANHVHTDDEGIVL